VPGQQAAPHTDMDCSLERGQSGVGCRQIPSESEDPSSGPWDHLDHCSRHVRRVRRHHMLRGLPGVGAGHPTAVREDRCAAAELGKAGRRAAEEPAGIAAVRHMVAAAGKSAARSWGGSFEPGGERAVRLAAGVAAHGRAARLAAAVARSRAGQEGRGRVRDSEGRRQAAGRGRSRSRRAAGAVGAAGAAGGSRHDQSHLDLCHHHGRLEEGHRTDSHPG
jgi:hypothetical protein